MPDDLGGFIRSFEFLENEKKVSNLILMRSESKYTSAPNHQELNYKDTHTFCYRINTWNLRHSCNHSFWSRRLRTDGY